MKITKYFLSMAAAIGMIAGCQKPEMVQISAPEDVVAPVLSPVADINITAANLGLESVTFEWSAADFGAQTQVNYAIEVAAAGQSDKVVVTSGVTETSAVVSYESLNAVLLYDLGLASGIAENVDFYVSAKVGEYAKVYSAPVTASATVTQAEKEYPKLTVAGSYAYNNWSPGKGQFVYDFEGTDAKYSGVIDFGEDVSALQFKFVGAAWGENEFSVPAGEAQAAEAAELPLVAGGGDNISAYTTHRFYSLTLDKNTPKVIKNFSFNSLGVIGDATPTGWDADTDMEFNAAKQRFYVDLTLIDGKIKFRADDDWAVNWGGADGVLSAGGADIAVAAGNYRIYVHLNDPANPTYELNAKMYGQDENAGSTTPEPEPEPEPTPVTGWSLIGAFNEWSGDLMLASDGTFYVIKGAELEGELKFRKDGDWTVNFGLGEGEFAADTELSLAANGANINVTAGTYDVYLDEANAKAWFITDGSYPGGGAAPEASEWGVVGQVNGWAAPDITMYKTATEGLFVAYNVAMPDGGFKIRANGEWNDAANYGLEGGKGNVEVDHAYDVITSGGSGDMILVAGNYDIWFDLTDTKVYIMTPGKPISEAEGGSAVAPEPEPEPEVQDWFLVGSFNGWTVADANYKMTLEDNWYVFKGLTLTDAAEVKFNAGGWDVNRGGVFTAVGEAIEAVQDAANLAVPAGTYDVYLSKDASVAYFMTPGEAPATPVQPWYLVGDFNGWTAADPAFEMLFEGGWYVFKGFEADGNGVKFVADASWSANRGGTFVAADEAIAVVQDGPNVAVAAGTYDVYLSADASVAYFMTPGTTPAI